ncbi:MAG: acyl-CoA dehydrogenase family protein [Acidimicrobiales bacterium]|nr:acyl-CoA dehydrogenase family protein [Acidimicrobiales bacterium]
MDLSLPVEEAAFRDECRDWLRDNLPWDYGTGLPPLFADLAEEVAFLRDWQCRLAGAGLVGVTWPVAFGGRGAGPMHHYLAQEELARARAPELVGRIGVNLVGPTLLAAGTPGQQQRWLPGILPADHLCCQLFSEPGAGSDLAAIATRAVATDDGWVLTGQKVWTSYAQFADWGLCLARTDPDSVGSRGLSMFMVDLHAPGVEVRPLRQITDESDFTEVFLGEVPVAGDQLVGDLHDGWRVSASTLSVERGTNARQLVVHSQLLEELFALAERNGAIEDPRLARDLAQALVEVRLFRIQNQRVLSRLAAGRDPGPVAATAQLAWSEMSQRLHGLVLRVLGDTAPLWRGADGNPGDGRWQRSWLYYRAATIFAGTSEIQRNLIGERTLDLPREPRLPGRTG